MREVLIGKKYKHFKGHIIEVLYLAKDSEDLRDLVVYKHVDDDVIWVRNKEEFLSEVDHKKYPNVEQTYRFELATDVGKDFTK